MIIVETPVRTLEREIAELDGEGAFQDALSAAFVEGAKQALGWVRYGGQSPAEYVRSFHSPSDKTH